MVHVVVEMCQMKTRHDHILTLCCCAIVFAFLVVVVVVVSSLNHE